MATNILPLPFRSTQPVNLGDAIRQYIAASFDQHPDEFKADLDEIDALRHAATSTLEAHSSYLIKLHQYIAQLVWLLSRFPVDIGVAFTWSPALGYNTHRPDAQNNLRFELANVLFNLAALYSQLALGCNRSTAEGLKTACGHFCSAAGVIDHLRTNILPDMRTAPPDDMDNLTLESVQKLMLAQAQECFWQKAVKDGLKDATIAKLAVQVSDYYDDARSWAIKSQGITSEWIHHMNAKHHHFAAASQYRASCDCMEKRKYGEEVARLRDSLSCVNEGLKESRYISSNVITDLDSLKSRVQQVLKGAEKDNDTIYLEPVPAKSEIKSLDRAVMVAAKTPAQVADCSALLAEGQLGRALFTRLVPYAVQLAASVYADRRDRLVNTKIVAEYEALTTQIHDTLASLNLPGSLQAVEKPLGLSPTVSVHAQQVRQMGGIQRLEKAIAETAKLKDDDIATYEQGVELLTSEANEDEASRRSYGTQNWQRATSRDANPKLFDQVTSIDGYLKQASNSDKLVQQKLREHQRLIRLLGGTDRDLEDHIPNSRRATITPKIEREAGNLRLILNDLDRLLSKRKRRIDQVQHKAKTDDVSRDLLREATRQEREVPMRAIETAQFEEFFDRRLQMYNTDQKEVITDAEAQGKLLQSVTQVNSLFNSARKGDQSTREREEAIQRLEAAYTAYGEIVKDVEGGRKFYNDLAVLVGRFRDDCRNFVNLRREEAVEVEADVAGSLASLRLQRANEKALLQEREEEMARIEREKAWEQQQRQQQQQQQDREREQRRSVARQGQVPGQNRADQRAAVGRRSMQDDHSAIIAPKPTRANITPPGLADSGLTTASDTGNRQAAKSGSGLPKAGVWNPDMPIKFG